MEKARIFEVKLQWDKYYIVKLSYFKGNPIHESIIYVRHDVEGEEIAVVFKGFSCEEIRINNLNYFEIVSHIDIKK